ncbi:hypothetical protein AB0G15_00740 [Streptosporangium sp. NPDC023825]|uniref:hypothetical protein n=1 Tax=Streptosporangium sp. NPDC023825 TaxID=3154909 RepID=UPI0034124B15
MRNESHVVVLRSLAWSKRLSSATPSEAASRWSPPGTPPAGTKACASRRRVSAGRVLWLSGARTVLPRIG